MSKVKKKSQSKSRRAGLQFPVGRVLTILKKGNYAPRVGSGAAVFLAAALEYLSAEILELATEVARQNNKNRVKPRHLLFAIKKDEELSQMLRGTIISDSGVMPSIQAELLPKKTVKSVEKSSQQY